MMPKMTINLKEASNKMAIDATIHVDIKNSS